MNPSELTAFVKAQALEIGFSKVGVTSAEPLNDAADRFESWVSAGSHGLMGYLERGHDSRRDVTNILPTAKSIISLALNYFHPGATNGDQDSGLNISRYAWGTDYHEVIPPMLSDLLERIRREVPQVEGRYYVDTGPLLEKAIAQRAGVGWIGKHTNLITREVGSWVFLAELILDTELVPDAPHADLCGTCTACIDACPTTAITAPYQLDSRKCISYVTIELKPQYEIPLELAPKMEGWLYGCDICQDVCPWNRFEQLSDIRAFAPRLENVGLTIKAIETMEQEEFSSRFKKSPVKRTKLAGLKRNVRGLQGE